MTPWRSRATGGKPRGAGDGDKSHPKFQIKTLTAPSSQDLNQILTRRVLEVKPPESPGFRLWKTKKARASRAQGNLQDCPPPPKGRRGSGLSSGSRGPGARPPAPVAPVSSLGPRPPEGVRPSAVAVGPRGWRTWAGLPSRPRPLSATRPVPGRSDGGERRTRRRARRLRSRVLPLRRSPKPRESRVPHGPENPREPPARSPIRSRSPFKDVPPPARSATFGAAEPGAATGAGALVRRLWRGRCGADAVASSGGGKGRGPKGRRAHLGPATGQRCLLRSKLWAAGRWRPGVNKDTLFYFPCFPCTVRPGGRPMISRPSNISFFLTWPNNAGTSSLHSFVHLWRSSWVPPWCACIMSLLVFETRRKDPGWGKSDALGFLWCSRGLDHKERFS